MLSPVGIELLTGSPNLTWYVLVLSCDLWWWLYVSFLCYQFNIINPMEGLNFLSIFIEFNFVFLLIHFLVYLVHYCSLWFCRPHSSLPFAVFISILAIYVDSCRKLSLSSLSRYHFLPPIFLGIEMYSSMMTVIWSVSFLFYLVQSLSLFINSIYYLFCYRCGFLSYTSQDFCEHLYNLTIRPNIHVHLCHMFAHLMYAYTSMHLRMCDWLGHYGNIDCGTTD